MMETLKNNDKNYIANTYNRFDVVIDHGQGATLYDPSGKEYVDFTSGIGVNSLGYSNQAWMTAITAQIAKVQHISNLFYTSPQVDVAKELVSKSDMSKVFFANSGAEANECAIKTARKWGNSCSNNTKNKIITLINGFHGRTMATITATGQDHYHESFFPFVDGFKYCPANDIETLKTLLTDDVCAIMMEMIQGEGGLLVLDKSFVQDVAQLCAETNTLLIVDEVQTGIGRTGTLFCYEQFNIKPDIVTFAKGIGAGLPLGGALLGSKVSNVLVPGDHGTTFGGNPVICAGAKVVLDTLTSDFLDEIKKKGDYIVSKLKEIPEIYEISGLGLMLGFKVKDTSSADFIKKCIPSGLLMLTAKDKVRILPPLVITYEEIDTAINIIKANL